MHRMSFRKTVALMASVIGFGLIQGLPGESLGRTTLLHVMRLPRGFLSVELARIRATSVPDLVQADVTVALTNPGPRSVAVSRSDFALSVQADLIGVQTWDAGNAPLAVRPGQSRVFRLTFRAPSEALERATFFYRPSGGGAAGDLPLNGSADFASADPRRAVARASTYR